MALLAERAGVSAATPYNLLGSKAEIIRLVIRDDVARFVSELGDLAGATPLAGLLLTADRLVAHYEGDRRFNQGVFRAAFGADAPEVRNVLSAESWTLWGNLVRTAIAGGELASWVRADQLTAVLLRMMGAVAQAWVTEAWPPERFALEMSVSVRMVLASVCVAACGTQWCERSKAWQVDLGASFRGTRQPA